MIWVYLTLVFFWGAFSGFLLHWWLIKHTSFSGTILVTKTEEKTLFSLELEEDPEQIAYRDEVIFKVVTSEENGDRT